MDIEDAPRDYTHTSVLCVWHDDAEGVSLALHTSPQDIAASKLDLGTITRLAHSTLDSAGSLPTENLFIVVHYVPSSAQIHFVMLPVGNERCREQMDMKLKTMEGVQTVLQNLGELCSGASTKRVDSVCILYDAPEHVRAEGGGEIAVIHELKANVDVTQTLSFAATLAENKV